MPEAANEADFKDPNCHDEARGAQWMRSEDGLPPTLEIVADDDPGNKWHFYYKRNGGLFFQRRAEFDQSDRLVRFASATSRSGRALSEVDLINSPWWMNDARFVDLWNRARQAGVGLAEMARRQLAIPTDWSTCELLVVAIPKVPLAAYSGPGLTADASGERRIIATEAPGLWIDQLYIPGLGRKPWLAAPPPNVAAQWLRFERARPTNQVDKGYIL